MKAQRGQATSQGHTAVSGRAGLRHHRAVPEVSARLASSRRCPDRGLCFRYGSYLVWKELGGFSEEAVVPLGLYAGQLTLNWAWPPIFFGTRQMGVVSASLLPGVGPRRVGLLRGT